MECLFQEFKHVFNIVKLINVIYQINIIKYHIIFVGN